jgi:hypothetical protein
MVYQPIGLQRSIDMQKSAKTKEELERLIVAELQTFADCEQALGIVVVSIGDCPDAATWTVARFNAGKSDGAACHQALQHIVPRFQRAYDLVQKH